MAGASRGDLFEVRVARLLHAEGAFVRRRVNLDRQIGGRVQVTDLDVLAFFFDDSLTLRLATGECKTAEAKNAPSTKDRLLWLAGVKSLVSAQEGFLATMKGARDVDRHFARSLGLEVADTRDLERREAIQALDADVGEVFHSADAISLEREVDVATAKDEELRRVWWFVRGELWLLDPVAALKRALGASRVLGARWSPELGGSEQRVLRWLVNETIVGLALALTRLAGESYRAPEAVFAQHLNERLAEGLASYDAMRQIASEVDKFLMGVLRDAGVDDSRLVGAMGALAPRPPSYAEPLLELIERLAVVPRQTRDLPRLAEFYVARDLFGGELAMPEPEGARLLRLVAAFVERQGRLPAELTEPLRRRPPQATHDGASELAVSAVPPPGPGEDSDDDASEDTRTQPLFREQV